jgi:predicted transcriptional regulator
MRNLLPIILIAFLVVTPSCKFFKGGSSKKAKALAAQLAKQDSIRVADSLRKVQDHLMALENAKLDSARRAEEERLAWERKYKFNIIVGSFVTPEYAKQLSEVYRTKGYETKILKMEGSKFELVSAEAHESFRKALARLKEFQDTIELDAWMYIRK